jgi:hypothetical protein
MVSGDASASIGLLYGSQFLEVALPCGDKLRWCGKIGDFHLVQFQFLHMATY